jgi:hypothetical protein
VLVKEIALTCIAACVLLGSICLRMGASLKAVLTGVGALIVSGVVGLVLAELSDRRAARREKAFRTSIEARYPGTRVNSIAEGKWRVEDAKTGRLECVLADDGVTVLSIRGQSVRP